MRFNVGRHRCIEEYVKVLEDGLLGRGQIVQQVEPGVYQL